MMTTDFFANAKWVNKLSFEFRDNDDGTGTVLIEWDEEDPDLEQWTNWGVEKQEAFILQALTNAVNTALPENVI